MTIAVDFDGTIVEHKYPAIGKEYPFAVDALLKLQADGHKIILWSVREGKRLDEAVDFCRKRGLEFYAVNSDFPNASWSGSGVSRKIKADIYIDDRNIGGIPDWTTIYNMISDGKWSKPKKKKKECFIARWHRRMKEARAKFR